MSDYCSIFLAFCSCCNWLSCEFIVISLQVTVTFFCVRLFVFALARALQALSDPYHQSTYLLFVWRLYVCLFDCKFDAKYLGN